MVPPPVSSTRGWCGQAGVGALPPCAPHCGHLAAVVTTLVPQGSVPRVRRPPSLGCPAALALGMRGAGEAESRSLRLLSSPGFPPSGPPWAHSADRCGDLTLSRAGPKPRQTRDGHSWRMGPLFSFCPRAPCSSASSSSSARCGGAGRARGEGCGLRPDPALPRSASWRPWDRGPLTQRTLSLAFLGSVW